MAKTLKIALVAHDARKNELMEWCKFNWEFLTQHELFATGTTAKLLKELTVDIHNNTITPFKHTKALLSGPLGGDQQIGSMIAEGKVDLLIFFCDNLITQGHHQDVGALTRLASLYNIAFATNRTTADMIITSPLVCDDLYERKLPTILEVYKNRKLD